MGFERQQIVRALRLAGNDVQNACDLLLSGAPLPDPATQATTGAIPLPCRDGILHLTIAFQSAAATASATDPQQEATTLMNDLIRRMQQQTTDPQAQFEWVVQQTQVNSTRRS